MKYDLFIYKFELNISIWEISSRLFIFIFNCNFKRDRMQSANSLFCVKGLCCDDRCLFLVSNFILFGINQCCESVSVECESGSKTFFLIFFLKNVIRKSMIFFIYTILWAWQKCKMLQWFVYLEAKKDADP